MSALPRPYPQCSYGRRRRGCQSESDLPPTPSTPSNINTTSRPAWGGDQATRPDPTHIKRKHPTNKPNQFLHIKDHIPRDSALLELVVDLEVETDLAYFGEGGFGDEGSVGAKREWERWRGRRR